MRTPVLVLFLFACNASPPQGKESREEKPPASALAMLNFAPADAAGAVHLDLRAAQRLIRGPKVEEGLDQLAQFAPACDRALVQSIETITVAFRQFDRPDQHVARIRGPIDREKLQRCLEGVAAKLPVFTVTSADKDLVIKDAAGAEFMVMTWQDAGILIGPRADLARTTGPENPALRDAIALVTKPDIAAWLVMARGPDLPGPLTFQALEEEGIRLRFGVRFDGSADAQADMQRLIDGLVKNFLEGAAERGGAVFDEAKLRGRIQVSTTGPWGLAQAQWTAAEVADLSTRLSEWMSASK